MTPMAQTNAMQEEKVMPHLKIRPSQISPLVLVCGDPARAKFISQMLENSQRIAKNREYYTFVGTYKGKKITVTSHGVGGGGASVCFEELIQAGAKVILRAGTCGSLNANFRDGSILAVTAAVRSDGVTDNLVPKGYPAVADWRVVQALCNVLQKSPDIKYGEGIIVTEGPFYGGVIEGKNELWSRAGVLAVEMEISVLFVIASLRGIRAGAILTVDNYIFDRLKGAEYNPDRVRNSVKKMCEIALDALVSIPL
jgi:uridine phosphorylase